MTWSCWTRPRRAALTARLVEAAGGPVDVVVDPVFGEAAAAAALALGPWGRLVNLGGSAHDLADFSSAALRGRSLSILGYTNNAISSEQRAEALTSVLALATRGAGVGRPPGAAAGRVQPGLDAGRCGRAAGRGRHQLTTRLSGPLDARI